MGVASVYDILEAIMLFFKSPTLMYLVNLRIYLTNIEDSLQYLMLDSGDLKSQTNFLK